MSTSTQYTTWSDLYTGLQNRVREQTSVTAIETIAKQFIDTAHMDIYIDNGEKFPWAERRGTITVNQQYSTGTISVTQGSTSITGSSTAWNTANGVGVNNMRVGGKMTISGSYEVYEVTAVSSDTAATISPAYIDADDTSASYVYFEDEYSLASDFLSPMDQRQFDQGRGIRILGRQDFRRAFPRNRTPSSQIRACCFLDKPFSGDTTPVRKVQFAPPPTAFAVIPYHYVTRNIVVANDGTEKASFTADTDEPIMPLPYRHLIVLHALYNWYRDRKDDARSQEALIEYQTLLRKVVGATEFGQQRARVVARVGGYRGRARAPYAAGSRLYDLHGRFDRFED